MAQVVHKVSPAVVRERINASPEEIAAFCRIHHIQWLALFSSVLRDDFSDESDIDTVAAFGPPQSPDYWAGDLWEVASDLFGGRKAEIVNYRRLYWRFRDRVLAHAETIYGTAPDDALRQTGRGVPPDEMTRDDRVYVAMMLDVAREVAGFISAKTREDYDSSDVLPHALAQCVTDMGRAAGKVSPSYRERYPAIPWEEFTVALDQITYPMHSDWRAIVWNITSAHFPMLVDDLEKIVPPEMRAEP